MLLVSLSVTAILIGSIEALQTSRTAGCPLIKLQNGRVRYRQRGRFVKFICTTGYIIAGEKYSTCVQGKWDTPVPKCVRPTCSKVAPPANGLIYPSHRGAVLNFFCKAGYHLKGSDVLHCDGKRWDSNLPNCIENGTKPATYCDFENDDLCGWNHDVNDDFDWIRLNTETPSGFIGTGPKFDHTKGENNSGYFMYIESSSKNENDTARLVSPIYGSTATDTCFELWYHMFGFATGQLRVYLKKVTEPWDLSKSESFFWKSGDQGNRWYHSLHHLGSIDEEYQIVIEGVRGSTYVGDIAIDDVRLIENCTNDDDFETTTYSSSYSDGEIMYDSCQNRCEMSSTTTNGTYNCACDDGCYGTNSCCPDYVIFCILGPTDDSLASFSTNTEPASEETTSVITTEEAKKNTIREVVPMANTTVKMRTSKGTTVSSTTYKNATKVTTQKTTMTTTKMRTTTAVPTVVRTTMRTATTTKKWYRKVPTKPKKYKERPIKFENDVLPVPKATIGDDVEFKVVTQSTKAVRGTTAVPIKRIFTHNSVSTIKQKIIVEKSRDNTKLYVILVGGVLLVLTTILGTACFVRRYRLGNCVRLRNMKSATNGDSQSDVRFFAGDEYLDFTLARPGYFDQHQ